MSLSDVAGVFSRYFILGFFLPVFFALIALWQLLTPDLVPDALDKKYEGATAVAILAGAAIPLGLVLLGIAYPVIRVLEGYFLVPARARWWTYPFWPVSRVLMWRQRTTFKALTRDRTQRRDPALRRSAAWRLDFYFPPEEDDLLPTRLGNAIRAFELHSWKRYRLDSIRAWPRVELLLSEQERDLLEEAQTEVAFFINSSLAAVVAGALFFADWIAFRSHTLEDIWWLAPLVLGYLLYRGAVEAATRWGDHVRACVDLHRFQMYEGLGLRLPGSNAEERALGEELSRFFTYGDEIDDVFRRPSDVPGEGGMSAAAGRAPMNPTSALQQRVTLWRALLLALIGAWAMRLGSSVRRLRRREH